MRLVIGWKRTDGKLAIMTPCGPRLEGESDAQYCLRIAQHCKAQWKTALESAVPKETKEATLIGWGLSDKTHKDFAEIDFKAFE